MLHHLIASPRDHFTTYKWHDYLEASITIQALHDSISGCHRPISAAASEAACTGVQAWHCTEVLEHELWLMLWKRILKNHGPETKLMKYFKIRFKNPKRAGPDYYRLPYGIIWLQL